MYELLKQRLVKDKKNFASIVRSTILILLGDYPSSIRRCSVNVANVLGVILMANSVFVFICLGIIDWRNGNWGLFAMAENGCSILMSYQRRVLGINGM